MKEEFEAIIEMLREYTVNKDRISFLENCMRHLTPEIDSEYIESRMFSKGDSGKTSKFIIVGGEEVSKLNKVEETAQIYSIICDKEYRHGVYENINELKELNFITRMIESTLEIIGRSHKRYKIILERYYINNESMEEIAESLHLSRSRCYELCKEAVSYMVKLVYGTGCKKVHCYV